MLKGINPLLTPDLLHALAAAGHGDVIGIVDANFPAVRLARRMVVLPGIDAQAILGAVLSVLPLDYFYTDPVRDFTITLERHGLADPTTLERHAFYHAAADAFVIVHIGERRFYGNILLTKGVIPPDARL